MTDLLAALARAAFEWTQWQARRERSPDSGVRDAEPAERDTLPSPGPPAQAPGAGAAVVSSASGVPLGAQMLASLPHGGAAAPESPVPPQQEAPPAMHVPTLRVPSTSAAAAGVEAERARQPRRRPFHLATALGLVAAALGAFALVVRPSGTRPPPEVARSMPVLPRPPHAVAPPPRLLDRPEAPLLQPPHRPRTARARPALPPAQPIAATVAPASSLPPLPAPPPATAEPKPERPPQCVSPIYTCGAL
jgi:hypothetical protein